MKLAPEPQYKKLYSQLKKDHDALKVENDHLKDKVYRLSNMVLSGNVGNIIVEGNGYPIEVPKRIAEWMIEFDLPWQIFKCDKHDLWFEDLDSCFPYHMEQCTCCKC